MPLNPDGSPASSPPQNPTFTPTSLNVSVAPGATLTTTLATLAPGDIITELWLNLQTQAANTDTAEQVTITVTNDLGQKIVDGHVIPGNCQSASSTNNIFTFIAVIPLLYRAAISGRTITIAITAPATPTIVGHVALGVRRNFRPFDNWRA